MSAPYVIGLIGKKRSGKDTFAQRLVELGFTRVAFADPLKAVALDLDPYIGRGHLRLSDLVSAKGWERAKEDPEVRRILQALGVAVRTHVKASAWVDAAEQAIREQTSPVVITDVRFENEVWFIEGAGDLVRIERPGLVSTDTHVSETELDGYPAEYTIQNGGTVADLRGKADELVLKLISGGSFRAGPARKVNLADYINPR